MSGFDEDAGGREGCTPGVRVRHDELLEGSFNYFTSLKSPSVPSASSQVALGRYINPEVSDYYVFLLFSVFSFHFSILCALNTAKNVAYPVRAYGTVY